MTIGTQHKNAVEPAHTKVSHNLAGQRLGRKGLETRERILVAMLRLLDDPGGPPVTLTSVAQEASIRLTNLYLYFPDFGTLLLAALNRVMDTAEAAFIGLSRPRWSDEGLGESCLAFARAHYRFWKRYARLLHMRNALAESDRRIFDHRQVGAGPLVELLQFQMDGTPNDPDEHKTQMATVALIGFERVATVVTGPLFHLAAPPDSAIEDFVDELIVAQARLIEVAIRDQRKSSTIRMRGRKNG